MTQSPWGIDRINEAKKKQSDEQMDAIKAECSIYAAVFNTSEGHKIMERLKAVLNSPTWSPEKDTNYGYFREGQNDIIRHIVNRVNKAKEF